MNLILKAAAETEAASLAQALDPALILAALPADWAPLGGCRPTSIAVERVHFRGQHPAVIQYRLNVGRTSPAPMLLGELIGPGAQDHAADETERLAKRRRRQVAPSDSSMLIALPALGLVLRPAGIDARLVGLRLANDARAARKCAARALGVSTKGWTPEVRLHAHRLGKRAVLQIDLFGPPGPHRVFARLRPVSNDAGARAFELHREIAGRLAEAKAIRVPLPLAYDEQFGAALYSALPGTTLNLTTANAPLQVETALRALSAFHAYGPPAGHAHRPADEIALLQDWIARIGAHLPALTPVCIRAFDDVAAALDALEPVELRPCHRDFHEGQVLIGDGRAGLLDFDTFRQSDPAMDLGNFIAHVRLAGLRARRNLMALEAPAQALGARDRIWVWTRAALLRLGCIHAFTSQGPKLALALFREAVR